MYQWTVDLGREYNEWRVEFEVVACGREKAECQKKGTLRGSENASQTLKADDEGVRRCSSGRGGISLPCFRGARVHEFMQCQAALHEHANSGEIDIGGLQVGM
jgi:hypothetical protein